MLNPAPAQKMSRELLALVDILVLNETELGFLAGTELTDDDEAAKIIAVARQLQARADQTICVTLGKRGVLALAASEEFAVQGRVVKAVDTTGAGDCFVGALASQLADGVPLARRPRLRQRRRLDQRAAHGRRAVDADGRGGGGGAQRRLITPARPSGQNFHPLPAPA